MATLAQYDVFLNHRGPDTKKTFVKNLNRALRREGREPFLDAKSLVQGEHAFNSINEALAGVRVHIAVFSPGYAESKYCLNELCDMLESRRPLIPVFYNVEPENLRRTDVGPFSEAFSRHLEKGRDADVCRWKVALQQASEIMGFKLSEFHNDSSELEKKVVAKVLELLPAPLSLPVARHPVGLKDSSSHIIDTLTEMGDNVGVMGVCGVGGIGKTTLVMEVFNQEQSKFRSRCFLKDVKEFEGTAIRDLQVKMVNDLLHVDATKMHWDFTIMFNRIQRKKVILVVDDITTRKQFDELIPRLDALAPGSRVLITSRDSNVLRSILQDVPGSAFFEVPELSLMNSICLFTRCAFRKDYLNAVDVAFHAFIEDIASACGGLPLALEVMGGFLSDKKNLPEDAKCWEEAAFSLRSNSDIMTSLHISYDRLNEEDKRMFLDIACFFPRYPKRVAIEIWESNKDLDGQSKTPSVSLYRLIDKSLVKVDSDGLLIMHDVLREMGRADKLGRKSHLWDPAIATKVLQKKQGSDLVLGFSAAQICAGVACKAERYASMQELRYLLLDGCPVSGNFSKWSKELRWLQWRFFPHETLPLTLELPSLVVLDLAQSNVLTRVWPRDFELEFPCEELRLLMLSGCIMLKELPPHMNKLWRLKYLNVEGCVALTSLPDSIGDLVGLEHINLSGCVGLESLPESIVKLRNLKEMLVEACTGLKTLPKEFGRLESLTTFSASETALEELPDSFRELSNLEELHLFKCTLLHKLPPSISWLKKLKVLLMAETALEELPEDFGLLQNVRKVDFEECKLLQKLPENIGSLSTLQFLSLKGCASLIRLPDSFSKLSNLEELYLSQCTLIHKLPPTLSQMKKLKVLLMDDTAIDELPEDFGSLRKLTTAHLSDCKLLQNLPQTVGGLSSLQVLKLNGCGKLTTIPDSLSELSNLEVLSLEMCTSLESLPPSIRGLEKLETLDLHDTAVKELPEDVGLLQSLTVVKLSECKLLQNLPEVIGRLSSLQVLQLEGCERLTQLPCSISELSKLESLDLSNCMLLQELPPLNGLKKLRTLHLSDTAFKELPQELGLLQTLTSINCRRCKKLKNLPEGLGCLKNLKFLSLEGCESLSRLPDSFSELSNLEDLHLSKCKLLKELPPFSQLKKLRVLAMSDLALKELPEDFGLLQSLTQVDLSGCKQLQHLPESFGHLGSLEVLSLEGCDALTKLPYLFSELSNLELLNLSGCVLLKKLPSSMNRLKKLRALLISDTALEELPKDFTLLQTEVELSKCKQFQNLPMFMSLMSPFSSYVCDRCQGDILSRRWRCQVCQGVDLCEACYEAGDSHEYPEDHSQDHPMDEAGDLHEYPEDHSQDHPMDVIATYANILALQSGEGNNSKTLRL